MHKCVLVSPMMGNTFAWIVNINKLIHCKVTSKIWKAPYLLVIKANLRDQAKEFFAVEVATSTFDDVIIVWKKFEETSNCADVVMVASEWRPWLTGPSANLLCDQLLGHRHFLMPMVMVNNNGWADNNETNKANWIG